MNCKHCNTSMKLVETSNRFLCETCQHSEPAIPVTPQSSNCTVQPLGRTATFCCQACDHGDLDIGRIGKTEVCFCGKCGGFGIDRGSLGDLVEELRSGYEGPDNTPVAIDSQQLQSQLVCLACETPMETMVYCGPGNVVIATCESCQLSWLNEGDLDRIVRAPGRRAYDTKLPGYTILKAGFLGTPIISHHG